MNRIIKVGKYKRKFNDLLGLTYDELEIYMSVGLSTHMIKRSHEKCLKYIDYIPDIIENPDYIGVNPNENIPSIELIKCYDDNILVGIKIDKDKDYFYVASMYDISESKIKRRLNSGRIKDFC